MAFTILALVAAILPGVLDWPGWGGLLPRYNANLAVLTITAVAIIWYTAFTYRTLEQTHWSRLQSMAWEHDKLCVLARYLLKALEAIQDEPEYELLRTASVWTSRQEDQLLESMHLLGGEMEFILARCVSHLRWLRAAIGRIQVEDQGTSSLEFRQLNIDKWRDHRAQAQISLLSILKESEQRSIKIYGRMLGKA